METTSTNTTGESLFKQADNSTSSQPPQKESSTSAFGSTLTLNPLPLANQTRFSQPEPMIPVSLSNPVLESKDKNELGVNKVDQPQSTSSMGLFSKLVAENTNASNTTQASIFGDNKAPEPKTQPGGLFSNLTGILTQTENIPKKTESAKPAVSQSSGLFPELFAGITSNTTNTTDNQGSQNIIKRRKTTALRSFLKFDF